MFTRLLPYLAAVVAVILLASCYKSDPSYCPGYVHNNCLNDIGPMTCVQDEDCPLEGAKFCDNLDTGLCVQCTPEKKSACTKDKPACIDRTCQPCTAHSQCDSQACLIDEGGVCAAPTDVAYVRGGGAGTACTLEMPCGTLKDAVAADKPYIKIAVGEVKDDILTTIAGKSVAILADPGAVLSRNGTGTILSVSGTSTKVSIYDLRISGATGASAYAIQLGPGGTTPLLTLNRVTVSGNEGKGIFADGGDLTVTRSTFEMNSGGAIDITASEAAFDITNNYIVRNGNAGDFGGVKLAVTIAGSSHFEFNTIADNRSASGVTRSGGVICDIAGFKAPNNIIARNFLGLSETMANSQTVGLCTYPTSKVQNVVADLNFGSPDAAPFSYKLTEGSAALDRASTPSTIMVDHDGDARPQGAEKDIGADELRR